MIDPSGHRRLGNSSVEVTALGLGGAALGNLYATVAEDDALGVVAEALDAGIRYFDTAPAYGYGVSEQRIGSGLMRTGADDVVIATKVGWRLDPATGTSDWGIWADAPALEVSMDFSPQAVRKSISESLARLGRERVDILWIHDPDEAASAGGRNPSAPSHFAEAMAGAYPVLDELRSRGSVGAIGVGLSQWEMLAEFAEAGDFDAFLLANRYTLLEQEPLRELFPLCEKNQISIVIGGAFNSGILATGAVEGARYDYAPASDRVLDRVRQLESVCARHRVDLPAAALQFPLAHPVVASVVFGARSRAEVADNCRYLRQEIPMAFWQELKERGMIDLDAPVPSPTGDAR